MMGENKYHFQNLTPCHDADLGIYKDSIDYVFKNDKIKNVAISGAYGAGKSSILSSYEERHHEYNWIHISLAQFKSPDDPDADDAVKESILEGKILNQLIHQIPVDKIPQTNFRVKKQIGKLGILGIILTILALFHIIYFVSWSEFVPKLSKDYLQWILQYSTDSHSLLFSGLICIIFLFCLLRRYMNKGIFSKISLQGNEIEILGNNDESCFDKYLNEVLYLFENSGTDVIVFDDIDRFNTTRIFERLREINILANMKRSKKGLKILRFFYLMRDDIFLSKDRTKFFDFIIPIVPIIDGSNSHEQFIQHFKKSDIHKNFDVNFLENISLYVDEMRILKNSYNEFIIYYHQLNTTELDYNKMFSIVLYKNLFPIDFSNLQLNKGFVFELFKNKEELRPENIRIQQELIGIKESEIELIRNEHLKSIEEIDFIVDIMKTGLTAKNRFDQNLYSSTDMRDKINAKIRELDIRRRANVVSKSTNKINSLENEIATIEQDIVLMQSKKIKDLLSRENIDDYFKRTATSETGNENTFHEVKENEYFGLLKYLIRNGYIDENYTGYMTYFHEGSLSRQDKMFWRSVMDKKEKEYSYELNTPGLVCKKLSLVDFDQKETLNFNLLSYLLVTTDGKHITFRDKLLAQLESTKNFKFVGEYLDTEVELGSYIKHLNLQWTNLFFELLEEHGLSENQIRKYSIYSLYYSDEDALTGINIDNCLSDYISNCSDYMDIENPDNEKVIDGFTTLEVKFKNIDYDKSNKELFNEVYKKSLYELNFENLTLMINKVYMLDNEDDICHQNYTIINSEQDSPLAQYVNDNISEYINIILEHSNGKITDDEPIALLILNNEDIEDEQKTQYIELLKTNIATISDVQEGSLLVWNALLEHKVAEYTEGNISSYFKSYQYTPQLISFINDGEPLLDFSTLTDNTEEGDEGFPLYDASIREEKLSNIKYKEIMSTLGCHYTTFDIPGLANEKLNILIDIGVIPMSVELLEFIRENYPACVSYFIEKNIDLYVNLITEASFNLDELVMILPLAIPDEPKLKLLELTNVPLSMSEQGYSFAINMHILEKNLYEDELPAIFEKYDNWEAELQLVIDSLAIKHIESVITSPDKTSLALVDKLFHSEELDTNIQISMLVSYMPRLDKSTCKGYLEKLSLTEFNKLFEPRLRPKFEINPTNEKLLQAFKNKGWIADFEVNSSDSTSFKVTK